MKNVLLQQLIKDDYNLNIFNEQKISLRSLIEEAIYLTLRLKKENENILVIKSNSYQASKLYEQLASFLSNEEVVLYQLEESIRVEMIAASPENTANSLETLEKISNKNKKIIITSIGSLIRPILSYDVYKENSLTINSGQNLKMQELVDYLNKAGYQKKMRVDDPLTYSIKGGIIDVFSINNNNPTRIEFYDEEIDSIRSFNINTKRTIDIIKQVKIIPASLIIFSDKEKEIINQKVKEIKKEDDLIDIINLDLDYLNSDVYDNRLFFYFSLLDNRYSIIDYIDSPTLYISDQNKIKESNDSILEDTYNYIMELKQENKLFMNDNFLMDYNLLIANKKTINNERLENYPNTNIDELNYYKGIENFVRNINDYDNLYKIIVCKEIDSTYIIDTLLDNKLNYQIVIDEIKPGINIIFDEIKEGFEFNNTVVFSSNELLEKKTKIGRYQNKYQDSIELNNFQELEINDYIVHNDYGIGRYKGIETRKHNGYHKDYLKVVYASDYELLVPVEKFSLIRKYAAKDSVNIRLHSIGTTKWAKTKEKVRENIKKLAVNLVDMYITRQKDIGYKFSADTKEQLEFEKEFEYELTIDQTQAVNEVKNDMEKEYPMDRLLCGDVGFGKTEVAIRAAFKAINDGKQVAFLCPTTVLSMQHYETIALRFKNYPVNVKVVNRFISDKEQKIIIDSLKKGGIDIIVGTHRLLSKDIIYHDLGLLVIDEEQRFGVEHKEKIKEYRNSIDVLSLSATPIPRTLQMSLIGMKKLSTINTPPSNRLPVQTYVVEKSLALILEVIKKELTRNGQVFYLLNDINKIYEVSRKLKANLKGVNIKVVHGKMDKEEIEDVMVAFKLNMVQILVCTTIIETGIDIPNANTIIIDDAHSLGLSQLYQIRGRVGRSSRLGYAYLMIPKNAQLKEVQASRLNAIKEFTKLGSGYKIAKRDLMIRGAGDILGPSQSGFIDSVGIDLYLEMLKEAIDLEKGIVKEKAKIEHAKVSLDNYLPKKYAPYDLEKIEIYQALDSIDNQDDLVSYKNKIIDMHGKMPIQVNNLFTKKSIEILLSKVYVESYKEDKSKATITFTKEYSHNIDGVKLFEYCNNLSKVINLTFNNQKIAVSVPLSKKNYEYLIEIVNNSKEFIKNENR